MLYNVGSPAWVLLTHFTIVIYCTKLVFAGGGGGNKIRRDLTNCFDPSERIPMQIHARLHPADCAYQFVNIPLRNPAIFPSNTLLSARQTIKAGEIGYIEKKSCMQLVKAWISHAHPKFTRLIAGGHRLRERHGSVQSKEETTRFHVG